MPNELSCSPDRPKPILHILITDLIIFGPVLAIPLALVDVASLQPAGLASWLAFIVTALAFAVIGAKLRLLGISLGYHRLATHPCYETKPWIRACFYLLGSTTAQGKMVNWLSDHHYHHLNSDKDTDIHSPIHGFWHAYIGWLRGILFDRRVVPMFANDRMVMFFSRTFFVWLIVGLAVPTLVGWATGFGAFRGLLWGGGIGMFLCNYTTYWVNAACHKFGQRDFNTADMSTNFWLKGFWGHTVSWLAAYMSWGETNHNNHHARSISANHGMFPGQFDPSANLLRILEKIGWVWNVKWTTPEEAAELQRRLRMTQEERKQEALERHGAKAPA